MVLLLNGCDTTILPQELEEITLAVARGEMDVEPLAIWFRQRLAS